MHVPSIYIKHIFITMITKTSSVVTPWYSVGFSPSELIHMVLKIFRFKGMLEYWFSNLTAY